MDVGARIVEIGILFREDGGFYLHRDLGGRYLLDLPRMPIDEVEKRVRVIGTYLARDHMLVEGVSLVV